MNIKKEIVFTFLGCCLLPYFANANVGRSMEGPVCPYAQKSRPAQCNTGGAGAQQYCNWVPGHWIYRSVYHQQYWIPAHWQCHFYYP